MATSLKKVLCPETRQLFRFFSGLECRSLSHARSVYGGPASKNHEAKRRYSTPVLARAQYGGRHTVTLLPGDGIGQELMPHIREVFRCAGVPVDFEEVELTNESDENDMENALLAIKRNGVCLKGNIETDIVKAGHRSKNIDLRTSLDLFAHIIHVKNIPGVATRHDNIDIVMIRENTEGEYANLEHENVPGVVESLKIITRERSTRIAEFAFEYAQKNGRKKVSAIHKANIMKLGDGLFLECCHKVSERYPDINFEGMIIDNASMQMVSRPEQFDVMVMPNLYGNIISNIGAGLVGGPGIIAGRNIGKNYAIFETGIRGSLRHKVGGNVANPCALLTAAADMLDYIGLPNHSQLIADSVHKVISQLKIHTPDLGGQNTTNEIVEAVISDIKQKTATYD
ncbi:isocitrate dehydrogenase [NAD] subunit gamma, mitochondrial-like [Lineus longissimus]|uniref:isocitrate dehydrogenase [NAD] subunit gamma, mitochondrial-like n=1 Tax=Lineus longissimus TaxID=88925 RepID=UPI002B4F9CEE